MMDFSLLLCVCAVFLVIPPFFVSPQRWGLFALLNQNVFFGVLFKLIFSLSLGENSHFSVM